MQRFSQNQKIETVEMEQHLNQREYNDVVDGMIERQVIHTLARSPRPSRKFQKSRYHKRYTPRRLNGRQAVPKALDPHAKNFEHSRDSEVDVPQILDPQATDFEPIGASEPEASHALNLFADDFEPIDRSELDATPDPRNDYPDMRKSLNIRQDLSQSVIVELGHALTPEPESYRRSIQLSFDGRYKYRSEDICPCDDYCDDCLEILKDRHSKLLNEQQILLRELASINKAHEVLCDNYKNLVHEITGSTTRFKMSEMFTTPCSHELNREGIQRDLSGCCSSCSYCTLEARLIRAVEINEFYRKTLSYYRAEYVNMIEEFRAFRENLRDLF